MMSFHARMGFLSSPACIVNQINTRRVSALCTVGLTQRVRTQSAGPVRQTGTVRTQYHHYSATHSLLNNVLRVWSSSLIQFSDFLVPDLLFSPLLRRTPCWRPTLPTTA